MAATAKNKLFSANTANGATAEAQVVEFINTNGLNFSDCKILVVQFYPTVVYSLFYFQ